MPPAVRRLARPAAPRTANRLHSFFLQYFAPPCRQRRHARMRAPWSSRSAIPSRWRSVMVTSCHRPAIPRRAAETSSPRFARLFCEHTGHVQMCPHMAMPRHWARHPPSALGSRPILINGCPSRSATTKRPHPLSRELGERKRVFVRRAYASARASRRWHSNKGCVSPRGDPGRDGSGWRLDGGRAGVPPWGRCAPVRRH